MDDAYWTLRRTGRVELKVLGSRFLAVAAPAAGRGDAEGILEKERKEHFAASHHCFAWRLGRKGADFRASDDGEPSGSAGKPILAAIDREGVTDAAVVVTRYFGGTKLGVGGLVRAYGEAAAAALREAGKAEVIDKEIVRAAVPHNQIGALHHAAALLGAKVLESSFGEEAHITLEIRASLAPALRAGLIDRTAGRVTFDP